MADEMTRKPYVRPVGAEWIFRHPRYLRYLARELSCLFIGGFALMLVRGLRRLSEGEEAYRAYLDTLQNPASVTFLVLALGFALVHSVTWFKLTPKALPLQIGERFVPGGVISGAHFAVWAVLSAAVLYFAGAL